MFLFWKRLELSKYYDVDVANDAAIFFLFLVYFSFCINDKKNIES